jgi:hypothetical protein
VILRTRLWKCQADGDSLLSIPACVPSRATSKPDIPTVEVAIAVTIHTIPAAEPNVVPIKVAIAVTVHAITAAQKNVVAIKVTIAVAVYASLTPKAVVIVVAIAPAAVAIDAPTSVRATSVPASVAGIMTINELLTLLILSAATSTPLRKSKSRHRYQQN